MRCTSPRKVGFQADGKTIAWSEKHHSKEFATFQLPCGKCIECRLEYARQWAVRCIQEASIHPQNSFITLTYNDENVTTRLEYKHFQDFMKRLRRTTNNELHYFVTGEYGDKTKRPHWHAIIFNWAPPDGQPIYKNTRGDQVFRSSTLDRLWGKGHTNYGSVTFESAGYCARYAAKKLGHGNDQDHDFHPISKKSNKRAIGKKFLELYWRDIFRTGKLVLPDGTTSSIPRYYEKWLKTNQPEGWLEYIATLKLEAVDRAAKKQQKEVDEHQKQVIQRFITHSSKYPITPNERRRKLAEARLKTLRTYQKL